MGATCVWETQEGWTGHRYHLRTKEVFDAEAFVIYQASAPLISDGRARTGIRFSLIPPPLTGRETTPQARPALRRGGHRGLLTTSRKGQRRHHPMGPGAQRGHRNEVAGEYAKSTATGDARVEEIPEGYGDGTSLSHVTRVAIEARSRETAKWISGHVRPERRYRPPPGRGLHRPQLRRVRKTLVGRYYQLLSGHAATGAHRLRFGMTDMSECWWCVSGEP